MTYGLSIIGVVFAGAIMFALIGAPATLQGCSIGLIASGVLIGIGLKK